MNTVMSSYLQIKSSITLQNIELFVYACILPAHHIEGAPAFVH